MRILLVDDDEPLMQALASSLAEHRYAVDVATDGAAAWNYIAVFDYDLIVLDIMLPKVDGISLCQQLRSQGYSTPILLLTARGTSIDVVRGLNAGADDYVVKPFDFEELMARIRALLRRETHAVPPVLQWDGLMLDTNACEAVYQGTSLHLTPKEYALLELFLHHPNQVFSPGAIIENLWSFEDPPQEEAVRTHIKGLRQKLSQVGAPRDLIRTVYGIGYRLKPLEEEIQPKTAVDIKVGMTASLRHSQAPTFQARERVTKAATLSAIAKAWEQFRKPIEKRLEILTQAAQATREGTLTQELQHQARSAAHKLVGSLGSFGFPEGSKLSAELETLLQTPLAIERAQPIEKLVQAIEQELKRQPFASSVSSLPLLLVISDDVKFAQQLAVAAKAWEIQTLISTAVQAKDSIQHNAPAAVLLALHQSSWELLAELHRQMPLLPIVAIADKSDFTARLEAVRGGAQILLTQPATLTQIMKAVRQVLRRFGRGAKVMIVDDDEQLLEILQIDLAPWEFELTTLSDPLQFWSVLEATVPDLLVLDVEMPEVSGIELCQVLRSEPRWRQLPVLFLTVHRDAKTQEQAFTFGADDYVYKPIVGAELANRILNRLERVRTFQDGEG